MRTDKLFRFLIAFLAAALVTVATAVVASAFNSFLLGGVISDRLLTLGSYGAGFAVGWKIMQRRGR